MASIRASGGLAGELEAAGGVSAPASTTARLRDVLAAALRRGRDELAKPRSGYDAPVEVGLAAQDGLLLGYPADIDASDLEELLAMAFEDRLARIDRLRARAVALPPGLLDAGGLRAPMGAGHPLRVAEAEARIGGGDDEQHEEAVLALAGAEQAAVRPHEDPDPARRVARRILQRLDGMGKWGGYHTDFAHLPRGFAGNDRALAQEVGEALLDAGLLEEKPSVGQRHVFLNPRRVRDIRAFIERGDAPPALQLPSR